MATQESEIARDRIYSIVASALSLAGGIAFGYFLFEKMRNSTSIPIPVAVTGGALVLLGMLLLSRWWIRANRSIAPGALISTQLKTERGFYLCVALIVAVGFDYIAYDLARNRIVEAVTALILTVPMGLFVLPIAFRLSRPFTALKRRPGRRASDYRS
jgi:hypothetical protein